MHRILADPVTAAVAFGATGTALAAWWMRQSNLKQSPVAAPSHGMAPEAAFFLVLPVDLQLCIVTTWLSHAGDENTLLHALSVLDVASCNHALRPDFLALAKHPAIVWADFCYEDYFSIGSVEYKRDTASFLKWLQSRVTKRIVMLHLDQLNGLVNYSIEPLAHIDTVVLFGIANAAGAEALKVVLEACSNLTSLTFQAADDTWKQVKHLVPSIQLKVLIFHGVVMFGPTNIFADFLARCPLGLEEVRIPTVDASDDIIDLLAIHADTLKVLEINCRILESIKLLELVQQCKVLEELVLTEFEIGTNADAEAIVDATKHNLKRFVLSGPCDEDCDFESIVDLNLFADLLERCLWLEKVHVINCSYDRISEELILTSSHFKLLEVPLIDRIASLNLCVRSLEFSTSDSSDFPDAVVDQARINLIRSMGKEITTFSIDSTTENMVVCLGECCPMLTTVTLMLCDDLLLKLLALSVKTVRRIGMCYGNYSDVGIGDMLTACQHLQEIHVKYGPKITSKTLDAILSLKHKLKRFTWSESIGLRSGWLWNDEQTVINKFRDSIKVQQLVPVPLLAKVSHPNKVNPYREVQSGNMFPDPLVGSERL